jgi:hypothetical protein
LIQCFWRASRYGRSGCFETKPSSIAGFSEQVWTDLALLKLARENSATIVQPVFSYASIAEGRADPRRPLPAIGGAKLYLLVMTTPNARR